MNTIVSCRGTLLIAEVVSRFDKASNFIRKLKKMGFSLANKVLFCIDYYLPDTLPDLK